MINYEQSFFRKIFFGNYEGKLLAGKNESNSKFLNGYFFFFMNISKCQEISGF